MPPKAPLTVKEFLRRLVAQGHEAVGLVGEERVEGVARDARGRDDLGHRRRLVAIAPDAFEHRSHDALALRGAHGGGGKLVTPARERLAAPLDF